MSQLKGTRSRILDVAEELFSEQGFDRVSIRDITNKARVNLAAINYHFGSKEDLIAAIFEREFVPVNEARLAALDAVQRSGKKDPKLEEILEAFIRPTVRSSIGKPKDGKAFTKLFGRCLSEPSPEIEALLKRQFEPLVERMDAALMKALPHLSRLDIYEGNHFQDVPGQSLQNRALRSAHIDQALKDTSLHFYTTTRFAQRMREKGFKATT